MYSSTIPYTTIFETRRSTSSVSVAKSPLRLPQLSEFACVATAVSTAAATPKAADFDDDEPIYELASCECACCTLDLYLG
ncbi:hypothetical protein EB796_010663 [Bugula neritina]|uniref:Uncharacterized protein n=1 Tax=Bugula neritina TaxID=10212 RepID=A0A7J7JZ98_BUGNE|nr:hypothetical protein EB796_010663 [Bugula neritina]